MCLNKIFETCIVFDSVKILICVRFSLKIFLPSHFFFSFWQLVSHQDFNIFFWKSRYDLVGTQSIDSTCLNPGKVKGKKIDQKIENSNLDFVEKKAILYFKIIVQECAETSEYGV